MNTQAIAYIQQGQYLEAARMLVLAVQDMTHVFSSYETFDCSQDPGGLHERRTKQQENIYSCWLQAEKVCCRYLGDNKQEQYLAEAWSGSTSNLSWRDGYVEDPTTTNDSLIYSYALDIKPVPSTNARFEDEATASHTFSCPRPLYGEDADVLLQDSDEQANHFRKHCGQANEKMLPGCYMISSRAVSQELMEPFLYAIHLYNAGLAFQLHGLSSKKSAFIVTAQTLYETTLAILLSDPHCVNAACEGNPLQHMYLKIVLAVANNLAVICLDHFERNSFFCARQIMSECLTLLFPPRQHEDNPVADSSSSSSWTQELSFFYMNLVLEFQQSFSVAPCA